jgi:hypothetical protein
LHGPPSNASRKRRSPAYIATFTGDSRDEAATAQMRVKTAAQITARFINGLSGADGSTQLNDGSWVDVKMKATPETPLFPPPAAAVPQASWETGTRPVSPRVTRRMASLCQLKATSSKSV